MTTRKRKPKIIDLKGPLKVGVFLQPEQHGWQLALADERDAVIIEFRDNAERIDLAMALLGADGAKANVKLTWPRPAAKNKKGGR